MDCSRFDGIGKQLEKQWANFFKVVMVNALCMCMTWPNSSSFK